MIKMAIIGMGGMAGWHVENSIKHKLGVKVIGGYDIQPETCKKRGKEWGIKIYASPQELYDDKDIELVLIATPNDSHKEYTINCLKSNKHVICEKPVTLNVADLEEVMAVAEETGKLFTIHQNRRWDADYMIIKKILSDGTLNHPYAIENRVQGSLKLYGWRAFRQNGGGVLMDWGVHMLDQMLDLLPHKVVSVYGHMHSIKDSEVDDCFTAVLRFENGCTAIVDISTNNFIVQPRWHLSCLDGTAVIEDWECKGKIVQQADPNEVNWKDAVVYTAAGPTRLMLPRPKETTLELPLPDMGESKWHCFYENVIDVLNGKAEPVVTPAQVLRVMKVIEAVLESNRTGQAVVMEV